MIRIDKPAIVADLRKNWLYFALLVAIPTAFEVYRNGYEFLPYILPVVAIGGLVLRFALRGWIARMQ